ncbi:hypothetical protein [Natrarchaeobius oligotrophus]|uniref:Uncharacterized protein n=1 Tax=Natrarchaeobius chitinivorans TaxID=1679083 RepID=A0A3N6PHC6_NATCH|nr:hypothetical protein [Natrarchaeobius chitinivorans]RQG99969.1 hypothetical protein EA472_12150 [Natrarchaeobius chitinivorans]
MWPTDLYLISGPTGLEATGYVAHGWVIEAYRTLSPVERAGVQFAGVLVVASVLLGMLQGYGSRAVEKSRRSPVISVCVGLPSLLVVGMLSSTGYFILGSSLGTFFGVILVVFGLTVLPAAAVIGVASIGTTISARLGRDALWLGVFVGSLVAGLAGLSLATTVALASVAIPLGLGTGVRILVGSGGATKPEERSVPPANKI